jgi:hypothetical protein
MSRRFVSLFVAPAAPATELGLPGGGPVAASLPRRGVRPVGSGDDGPSRQPRRSGRRRPANPTAALTAVIGDADSAAFAVDLVGVTAARGGLRCGLTAVWGAPLPAGPRGHPTRAAEHLAARLVAAGYAPVAGGRGVVVGLPEDPVAAVREFARLAAIADDPAAVVLALCGPRESAFDALLAGRALLVLALAAGAPATLAGPATAALAALAPAARLVVVTLDTGGALPRPLRHRTAIRQILEAGR